MALTILLYWGVLHILAYSFQSWRWVYEFRYSATDTFFRVVTIFFFFIQTSIFYYDVLRNVLISYIRLHLDIPWLANPWPCFEKLPPLITFIFTWDKITTNLPSFTVFYSLFTSTQIYILLDHIRGFFLFIEIKKERFSYLLYLPCFLGAVCKQEDGTEP